MPYICKSLTPYISSNCNHCRAVSGAVEQLISRRVGKSFAPSLSSPPVPLIGARLRGNGAANSSPPPCGEGLGVGVGGCGTAVPGGTTPHPDPPPQGGRESQLARPPPNLAPMSLSLSSPARGAGRGGGLFSSILRTVGTPAANVMPYRSIHSKKRLWEKRLAMCMVSPFCRNGIRLSTCAEFQPKERYSSVRSFSVRPRNSRVDKPLSQ